MNPSVTKIRWICHILWMLLAGEVSGQNPGWLPPSGSGYRFTSNVIGNISLDGNRSNDAADRIAFFSGEELIGLSKPVSAGNGQYLHFVTLYSNADAVFLTIKIFHNQTNQVYEVLSPFQFKVQYVFGSVEQPYMLNIYTPNNVPFSISGVPVQFTMEGLAFQPVNLAPYLMQVRPKPVVWSFEPNPNLLVSLTGNLLHVQSIAGFTGQTQLLVMATEQISGSAAPHSSGSSRNYPSSGQTAETAITFSVSPRLADPAWHPIPPQGIISGGMFSPVPLHNYEYQYNGPAILYSYQPVMEAQVPAETRPMWETSGFYSSNMNLTLRMDYTPKYRFHHADDILAAFINGELRGVATRKADSGLYYLTVGGSVHAEDSITIRFYSGALKKVFTRSNFFIYKPYTIAGTTDFPIIMDLAPIVPVVPDSPVPGGNAVMPVLIADPLFTGTVRFVFSAADPMYPDYLRGETETSFCIVADSSELIIQYLDADGDGLGNPEFYISSCVHTPGYVDNSDDCDDSQIYDPAILLLISENSGYAPDDGFVCSGSPVSLLASGGIDYLWSTGQVAASINPVILSDSTFYVTVTFGSGCKGVSFAVIKKEGKIVTNSGDTGLGSLRSVISCVSDGDIVTYDQPLVSTSSLNSRIFVNNTIAIEGLSSMERPDILMDFSQNTYGFQVTGDKILTLKNIDVTLLNNTVHPLITGEGSVVIDGLVKIK